MFNLIIIFPWYSSFWDLECQSQATSAYYFPHFTRVCRSPIRSTGVSLLPVHALELCVPACKAEQITATLSSISTPTDHLSTASVWELTSTLIQQSINHNWLEAIMVSDPSVSEGGIAFINNISSWHGPHLLSMMKVFMLVSVLSLFPRERSDLWSPFPPTERWSH